MKNKITHQIVFLFLLSFSIYSGHVNAENQHVSDNIYKQLIAVKCDSLVQANLTNPNFVILDVRTHGEWVGDHLEGSINLSTGNSDFAQRLAELPKHKIFLLHCKSGGRSAGAFAKMKTLGFAEVYEMIGGINSWKNNALPTTSELAPKLMLVSLTESINNSSDADTINVTLTNRANESLVFNSVIFSDVHEIKDDFNSSEIIEGAEDYTFSIIHSPGYTDNDSTKVTIESNGGPLEINIVFKNGVIQNVKPDVNNEWLLYPNPAQNYLYFKNVLALEMDEISIVNLQGQVVLNEKYLSFSNGINVSHLQNGVYFVRIKSNNSYQIRKVIIKH